MEADQVCFHPRLAGENYDGAECGGVKSNNENMYNVGGKKISLYSQKF